MVFVCKWMSSWEAGISDGIHLHAAQLSNENPTKMGGQHRVQNRVHDCFFWLVS